MSEKTVAGKSSQSIQAVREPALTPLVPEGYKTDPKAYCRFREDLTEVAPELLAWIRR